MQRSLSGFPTASNDRIQRAAENPLGWSSSRRTSWISDVKSERSSFHAGLRYCYSSNDPATSPRPERPPSPSHPHRRPTGWAQTASATVLSGGSKKGMRHRPRAAEYLFRTAGSAIKVKQARLQPRSRVIYLPEVVEVVVGGGNGRRRQRRESKDTESFCGFYLLRFFFFFPRSILARTHSPRAETSSKGGAGGRTLYLLYDCLRRRWEPT